MAILTRRKASVKKGLPRQCSRTAFLPRKGSLRRCHRLCPAQGPHSCVCASQRRGGELSRAQNRLRKAGNATSAIGVQTQQQCKGDFVCEQGCSADYGCPRVCALLFGTKCFLAWSPRRPRCASTGSRGQSQEKTKGISSAFRRGFFADDACGDEVLRQSPLGAFAAPVTHGVLCAGSGFALAGVPLSLCGGAAPPWQGVPLSLGGVRRGRGWDEVGLDWAGCRFPFAGVPLSCGGGAASPWRGYRFLFVEFGERGGWGEVGLHWAVVQLSLGGGTAFPWGGRCPWAGVPLPLGGVPLPLGRGWMAMKNHKKL